MSMTKRDRQIRERSIPTCTQCNHKVALWLQERGYDICSSCYAETEATNEKANAAQCVTAGETANINN